METELQRNQYPQVWQVIVIILLTIFIAFIFGLIGLLLGANKAIFLLEAILILPALIFTLKNKFSPTVIFRLRPVNIKIITISVVIAFAVTIISDELDRISQIFLPLPEIIRDALENSLKIKSTSDLIIIIISAVFLAAIVEEMLFRGFLQASLEKQLGVKKAIVLSAIIFSFVHGNPWWIIQIIIIGILLGVMAWKSNSIIPSSIVHLINNGMAITFLNVKPAYFSWYLDNEHVSISILIIAIVVAWFGLVLFFRLCKSASTE
jgi:membrane protease YdiL (CAAX protease family)